MKVSNYLTFVILIFTILKFRIIDRRLKFGSPDEIFSNLLIYEFYKKFQKIKTNQKKSEKL